MTTISVPYDEPLQIGDLVTYGDVFGREQECRVVDVVDNDVYCIKNPRCGKTKHVRRARHRGGVENKIYVFVHRGESGRWKRDDTGAATEWVSNARRQM